ncbi:NYN domain-containing protein [Bauldia litoralis]|uniref:NYN domain-containing protein n=1 Tax=Bauldia litoralis TaxID=665467 RepID=UPI0032995331
MANTIKSALFVDYDSFHRSLEAAHADVAELLAQKAATLVSAIETGKLVTPEVEEGARRRSLIRRCYADPQLLGKNRSAFIASGFEVIDCPPLEGSDRNSAAIHIILDAMDALGHPAGYEEFILLSADTDLTPMLLRLRAHNRLTVIYADDVTSSSYKAIADAMIAEQDFIDLLVSEEAPPEPEVEADALAEAEAPAAAGDRSALEALARKIHAATNVPMFSPRTFADLFRFLAQEVGESGYHFQQTAEKVTERLTDAGRNANRRQVLFVVKGLALKGHVFSTSDTPERLAEVFREQVLYLAGSAGVDVTAEDAALLPSWIVGRSAAPPARPAAPPPATKTPDKPPERKSILRRRPTRPVSVKPDAEKAEKAEKTERPARAEKEEAPTKQAAPAEPETPPAPKAEPSQSSGSSHLRRLAELRASSASRAPGRLAALRAKKDEKAEPSDKEAAPTKDAPTQSAAAQLKPPAKAAKSGDAPDGLENSILAAIAQAVDVLVEDGGPPANARDTADEGQVEADVEIDLDLDIEEASPLDTDPLIAAEPPPEAEPSEGGDSDDIGDEIQRIIASYSRARQQS